jgi:hypothetical protein
LKQKLQTGAIVGGLTFFGETLRLNSKVKNQKSKNLGSTYPMRYGYAFRLTLSIIFLKENGKFQLKKQNPFPVTLLQRNAIIA